MNNIGQILAQVMSFEKDTEEELCNMAKHSSIKFSFYCGYIIMFDKVNVHAITPHMLEFSKNGYKLIVLHYDEYHEDDDLFFIEEE